MTDVQVDLADDRFDITYRPEDTTQLELLDVVTKAGYSPEVVVKPTGDSRQATTQVDLTQLPPGLTEVFARARSVKALVLLDFTGPG